MDRRNGSRAVRMNRLVGIRLTTIVPRIGGARLSDGLCWPATVPKTAFRFTMMKATATDMSVVLISGELGLRSRGTNVVMNSANLQISYTATVL